ncbi:MAG TPA: DUF47 family protein [Candidatus Paceibacterota bacterium]|nr:DUF47 family protein [Verrucomicrobiota bacterium]HRY46469.1 DUF47 family protein [Candidatus Paceibacterota bacterium]
MISLQRLFGKDTRFFDLLEASAEEARQAAQALIDLLEAPEGSWSLDEFILRRQKEKRLNEEITVLLCKTFVTPLEREDIEALSSVLYKIPKTIEKFGERLLVSRTSLKGSEFMRQARLLENATESVALMVKQLRRPPPLEKVKELNDRLQHYEGEADKLILELLRDLYSGRYDPLQVVILRNLYELLEKVIDRCRDAGNVVFHIILKHA